MNTSPPPVASMPAELGKSVSGTSHFFSPVSGLIASEVTEHIARLHRRDSCGDAGGVGAEDGCFGGAIFWMRGTSHVLA